MTMRRILQVVFLDCVAARVPGYRVIYMRLPAKPAIRLLLKGACLMNEQTHRKNRSGLEAFRILLDMALRTAPIAVLAIALGLFHGASLSAQTRHIELNDYAKITSVSDPQISPDGKTIVFVVSRPNLDQDRSDRELVLIEIGTGAQHVLTYERKGVGSPRWSPTGDRLAFVAADGAGKDAKPQVFILPMAGGEARKITETPNGIEQFAWRPNGQEIAYVTSDEPENKKEIEKHHDAFEVGDNDFLATEAEQSSHLWLIPTEGGKAKRLTSGTWSLPKSAPPSSPASPISWSPDGKWLLFTRQEHPRQGDADLATLQVLNVETGETRKLTKHEKLESFGLFSPDGSRVAYWYPRDGDPNNENEIFVTQTTGGDGLDATRSIDRDLLRVQKVEIGRAHV